MNLKTKVRCWLIRKLIGKMPVVANTRVSDYDADNNLKTWNKEKNYYMFYNNKIYKLDQYLKETVWSGNKGEVQRHGNMFVLTR